MNTSFIPAFHRETIVRLYKGGNVLLPQMEAYDIDLLHAAVGISTEAGELMEAVINNEMTTVMLNLEENPQTRVAPAICLVNMREELGDHLFYEGALRIAAELETLPEGLKLSDERWEIVETRAGFPLEVLVMLHNALTGQILDVIKRKSIYRKGLDDREAEGEPTLREKLAQHLFDDCWVIGRIIDRIGSTDTEIREGNIMKLEKGKNARYREGYSDEAANARADKAEEGVAAKGAARLAFLSTAEADLDADNLPTEA